MRELCNFKQGPSLANQQLQADIAKATQSDECKSVFSSIPRKSPAQNPVICESLLRDRVLTSKNGLRSFSIQHQVVRKLFGEALSQSCFFGGVCQVLSKLILPAPQ